MDVERLLGQLLSSGLSKHGSKHRTHYGSGHGSGFKKAAAKAAFSKQGLTLLAGIGVAAYEHFKAQSAAARPAAQHPPAHHPAHPPTGYSTTSHSSAPQSTTAHSPPQQPGAWQVRMSAAPQPPSAPGVPPPFPGAAPPPLTTGAGAPVPPSMPASVPDAPWVQPPADLLLLAMVEAAKADGHLDADERARILDQLDASGATAEERAYVERMMAAPPDPDALVARATDPGTKAEIYAASRLAIEPDTEAERTYLAWLAGRLGLPRAAIDDIERRLAEARDAEQD